MPFCSTLYLSQRGIHVVHALTDSVWPVDHRNVHQGFPSRRHGTPRHGFHGLSRRCSPQHAPPADQQGRCFGHRPHYGARHRHWCQVRCGILLHAPTAPRKVRGIQVILSWPSMHPLPIPRAVPACMGYCYGEEHLEMPFVSPCGFLVALDVHHCTPCCTEALGKAQEMILLAMHVGGGGGHAASMLRNKCGNISCPTTRVENSWHRYSSFLKGIFPAIAAAASASRSPSTSESGECAIFPGAMHESFIQALYHSPLTPSDLRCIIQRRRLMVARRRTAISQDGKHNSKGVDCISITSTKAQNPEP